ncbi:acyl-CoA thioesterase [Clostridium autoethanogenum]|uniref:Acyl-CoA thioesterase n=1 Tax=Clostridium autoethanogenum TaxID=84023 RepID=A0A3M0SVA7_9CLOT|nr:SGNH/GDSL hydrolase family protein [Clostridium autoethanogenum]RMD02384.1 acyl-CoA thioesterase [Clostridium autoethanogenum]
MNKKSRFTILSIAACIFTIVFAAGFAYSISITNASGSTSSKVTNKGSENKAVDTKIKKLNSNSYNILVMGDSLARGTGDETNSGFANDFSKLWKSKTKKSIEVTNIAVNGDVSSGLLNIVKSKQTLQYVQDSNMIFISIGGNEIKNFKNSSTVPSAVQTDSLKTVENKYMKNLSDVFKLIRSRNQNSIIVFIGLYNPFGSELTEDKLELLNEWNYKTDQLVSSDDNAIYIPTYDLFKYNSGNYFAADNFHPNSIGYEAISKRMFEALKNYK